MTTVRPRILVFVSHYLPGDKGGGPIRSVANLIDALGEEFDFHVVTSDRDFGERAPYAGVPVDEWIAVGKAHVMYLSHDSQSAMGILRILRSTPHEVLYLNSTFSRRFSLLPFLLRATRMAGRATVVMAPRGQFSPGALQFKTNRKRLFVALSRTLGLYRNVIWHASTALEHEDIDRVFGEECRVFEAGNIAGAPALARDRRHTKTSGKLALVFVSRISPKKNLDGALRLIGDLQGDITFDIFGPAEDQAYFERCQRLMRELPAHITASYRGALRHADVGPALAVRDVFFFPTHGENYGHVVTEALLAGCPVLTSDQTPWRDLEHKGVGWDIPLDRPDRFKAVLKQCVDMDGEEFEGLRSRALAFGEARRNDPLILQQNRELFRYAASLCQGIKR